VREDLFSNFFSEILKKVLTTSVKIDKKNFDHTLHLYINRYLSSQSEGFLSLREGDRLWVEAGI
jgi:hypothetical protein